jgi:hypothetical protein
MTPIILIASLAFGIVVAVLMMAAIVLGSSVAGLLGTPQPGETRSDVARRAMRHTAQVFLHPIKSVRGTHTTDATADTNVAASDPSVLLNGWTEDLLGAITATLPASIDADRYRTQITRTMTPQAYQVWLPHMATYLGHGTAGQPVALTGVEMAHLADWHSLAGDDAPVYAMSRLTMSEAADRIARGDGGVRALAIRRGWFPAPHQGNQALGA